MPKITIDLDLNVHDKPCEEVEVNDIIRMSRKARVKGTELTLRDNRILKSTNSFLDVRDAINLAKSNNN